MAVRRPSLIFTGQHGRGPDIGLSHHQVLACWSLVPTGVGSKVSRLTKAPQQAMYWPINVETMFQRLALPNAGV